MSKAHKEASKVNLCILYISFQMALLSDGYSFVSKMVLKVDLPTFSSLGNIIPHIYVLYMVFNKFV